SDYYAYQHNLGTLYTKMGRFEEALAPFKKALKMRPDSTMILFAIGRCYEEISQDEKAKEYFMLAAKSAPRNGREYVSQGMSFLKLGNDEKALECFFEAVRVDPLDINVRIHLAKTLFGIGYFDGAFKHYSIASEISPNNAPAYKGMGLVMLEKGDSKEAKKYLDKALNLLPPDSPERKEILELLDKTKG
ncbi:MAG: tetratricopeptide repeat protein, partial [Nitrospirota bacterium]